MAIIQLALIMAQHTFTITAVQLEDVPVIAQLSADAFETDRQTEMKGLGKEPFDMRKHCLDALPRELNHPRLVLIKAVDNETGDIMGYCNWGFRGFDADEMPIVEGRRPTPNTPIVPIKAEATNAAEEVDESAKTAPEDDPVKRLEALTDSDMQAWMTEVMPEGTRCIFIVGLSVSPKHQGRGVGSALLRWGTTFCDAKGAFAWVHSSEPAWRVYEKAGFTTIRELDIDLDDYAPMPPPNEASGAKWGHYVFRYMKYFPKYL